MIANRSYAVVAVALLLALACGRETRESEPAAAASSPPVGAGAATPVPASDVVAVPAPTKESFDGCVTGTRLGADGHVAEPKSVFTVKEAVWVTVGSTKAAPKQEVEVKVIDVAGQELKSVFKDVDQERVVTFPLRDLPPGRYRAVCTWGTTQNWQVPFEVR